MNPIVRISIIIGLLAVIIFSLYALLLNSEDNSYADELQIERAEKDIWLSNDFSSPFNVTNTPFKRLNYFEPDIKYRVNAKLIRAVTDERLTLITNTGENQEYIIFGSAIFQMEGKDCLLKLLKAEESDQLFLPFMDKTSGNETYGAGRYLDLDIPVKDEIILDFNKAYNPYCAYTEIYSCPFPPKSNVIDIAIRAGEKSYD